MDSPETLATCHVIHVQCITFIFRNKEPHFTPNKSCNVKKSTCIYHEIHHYLKMNTPTCTHNQQYSVRCLITVQQNKYQSYQLENIIGRGIVGRMQKKRKNKLHLLCPGSGVRAWGGSHSIYRHTFLYMASLTSKLHRYYQRMSLRSLINTNQNEKILIGQ